jgi:hypothetical protein
VEHLLWFIARYHLLCFFAFYDYYDSLFSLCIFGFDSIHLAAVSPGMASTHTEHLGVTGARKNCHVHHDTVAIEIAFVPLTSVSVRGTLSIIAQKHVDYLGESLERRALRLGFTLPHTRLNRLRPGPLYMEYVYCSSVA